MHAESLLAEKEQIAVLKKKERWPSSLVGRGEKREKKGEIKAKGIAYNGLGREPRAREDLTSSRLQGEKKKIADRIRL